MHDWLWPAAGLRFLHRRLAEWEAMCLAAAVRDSPQARKPRAASDLRRPGAFFSGFGSQASVSTLTLMMVSLEPREESVQRDVSLSVTNGKKVDRHCHAQTGRG